jgi:hypothetical protein
MRNARIALAFSLVFAVFPVWADAPPVPVAAVSACPDAWRADALAPEPALTPVPAPEETAAGLDLLPEPSAASLRTCRCSCGFRCTTDADCGPGGRCLPGISCC